MSRIKLTQRQRLWLTNAPRVAGIIAVGCSLFIIYTVLSSAYRRNRIYHRLMLACAMNICIVSFIYVIGPLAVPQHLNHLGFANEPHGNTTTCTIQGFFYQVLTLVVPLYYDALSLLCFAAIYYNFQAPKYTWIEKWIYFGVYVFPLSSAIYFLSVDAYNPAIRDCGIASLPFGCGDVDNEGVVCERGPNNLEVLFTWLVGTPFIFTLAFPAFVMTIVYLHVRMKINAHVAYLVSKQIALYLLALYWTYGFRVVDSAIYLYRKRYTFSTNLMANVNEALFGLWFLVVYWYFQADDRPPSSSAGTNSSSSSNTKNTKPQTDQQPQPRPNIADDGNGVSQACRSSQHEGQHYTKSHQPNATSSNDHNRNNKRPERSIVAPADMETKNNDRPTSWKEYLFGSRIFRTNNAKSIQKNNDDNHSEEVGDGEGNSHKNFGGAAGGGGSMSFSIFDGTNIHDSNSPWAVFLVDEYEDEEYQVDCGEYEDTEYFGLR